jgi:hypothetical protein
LRITAAILPITKPGLQIVCNSTFRLACWKRKSFSILTQEHPAAFQNLSSFFSPHLLKASGENTCRMGTLPKGHVLISVAQAVFEIGADLVVIFCFPTPFSLSGM